MRTLLFFLLASSCLASGSKHSFKDPLLNDEIDNIYFKIGSATQNILYFTKAQLLALTPRRAGLIFFCIDCTTDGIVVSTAATLGGVGRISARTTAIN